MKRKIFYKVIVITGCLALSLTACGKKQNTETDTTQITSTTSQDSTEPTSDMNSSNTTAISKEEMQKIADTRNNRTKAIYHCEYSLQFRGAECEYKYCIYRRWKDHRN